LLIVNGQLSIDKTNHKSNLKNILKIIIHNWEKEKKSLLK